MRRLIETVVVVLALAGVVGVGTFVYFVSTGLNAKPQPGAMETFVAQRVRNAVIGMRSRNMTSPVAATAETIAAGRAHFADHCASCHGNDGGGNTEMGRGLYPKAPDMRLSQTQDLSDGQLFYIIENGVRLTGMPAWGNGTEAGEADSWHLVHFIRHLPQLTPEELEEMQALNPRSPEEVRQEIEAEKFLQGGEVQPSTTDLPDHAGGHHE